MSRRGLENRYDLALLHPVPHQRGIPARAERERKSIEQD